MYAQIPNDTVNDIQNSIFNHKKGLIHTSAVDVCCCEFNSLAIRPTSCFHDMPRSKYLQLELELMLSEFYHGTKHARINSSICQKRLGSLTCLSYMRLCKRNDVCGVEFHLLCEFRIRGTPENNRNKMCLIHMR